MIDIALSDKAHLLRHRMRKVAEGVKVNFVELIRCLKEIKDGDYHVALGYDKFSDFVRDEEAAIGFRYNTVRAYIHLYELYTDIDRVAELEFLGPYRAQLIAGQVKEDPDEWIAKAETLSTKDLINETRLASGKQEMPVLPPPESPSPVSSSCLTPDGYVKLVRRSRCCVCGRFDEKAGSTPHHHPRKRGRVEGLDYKVIPLCGECHSLYHSQESRYRHEWDKFFYDWLYRLVVDEGKQIT